MTYRIYDAMPNGMAKATDMALDKTTNVVMNSPFKGSSRITTQAAVHKTGCVMSNQTNMVSGNLNQSAYQVGTGMQKVVRPVTTGVTGSTTGQWFIRITNGSATAQTAVIGDYCGIISDRLFPTVLPATVTIDGTFGARTLAQFKVITGVVPVILKELHLEADTEAFFSGGQVTNLLADIENKSPMEKQIYFNKLATGNTFNPAIRQDENYEFLLNALSAVAIRVPAGRTITATWNLTYFASSYLMQPNF